MSRLRWRTRAAVVAIIGRPVADTIAVACGSTAVVLVGTSVARRAVIHRTSALLLLSDGGKTMCAGSLCSSRVGRSRPAARSAPLGRPCPSLCRLFSFGPFSPPLASSSPSCVHFGMAKAARSTSRQIGDDGRQWGLSCFFFAIFFGPVVATMGGCPHGGAAPREKSTRSNSGERGVSKDAFRARPTVRARTGSYDGLSHIVAWHAARPP